MAFKTWLLQCPAFFGGQTSDYLVDEASSAADASSSSDDDPEEEGLYRSIASLLEKRQPTPNSVLDAKMAKAFEQECRALRQPKPIKHRLEALERSVSEADLGHYTKGPR